MSFHVEIKTLLLTDLFRLKPALSYGMVFHSRLQLSSVALQKIYVHLQEQAGICGGNIELRIVRMTF
jgi:hypothetical protein